MKWNVGLAKKFAELTKFIDSECRVKTSESELSTVVIDASHIAVANVKVGIPEGEETEFGVNLDRFNSVFGALNTKEAIIELVDGGVIITGGKYEYRLPFIVDARTSKWPQLSWPLDVGLDVGEFYDAVQAVKGVSEAKDSGAAIYFKWDGKELRISDGAIVNIIFEEGDITSDDPLPESKCMSKFPLDFMLEFSRQVKTADLMRFHLGMNMPMSLDLAGNGWVVTYVLANRIDDDGS